MIGGAKQVENQQKIQAIKAVWQEGVDSGSAGVLNMEEIKREARQHFVKEY